MSQRVQKWHQSEDGLLRPCGAKPGNCPKHITDADHPRLTKAEAENRNEATLSEQNRIFKSVSKKGVLPELRKWKDATDEEKAGYEKQMEAQTLPKSRKDFPHLSKDEYKDIQRRIHNPEEARGDMDNASTLAYLRGGFSEQQLNDTLLSVDDVRTQHAGVVSVPQKGGEPVVGLEYAPDFRTEEEVGLPHLVQTLEDADDQTEYVRLETLENGDTALAIVPNTDWLGDRSMSAFSQNAQWAIQSESETAERHARPGWFSPYPDPDRMKAAELRKALKANGVEKLPRKTTELAKLYKEEITNKTGHIGASFHSGNALVFIARGENPAQVAVLEKLAKAAESNSLRFGGDENVAQGRPVLIDKRDLSASTLEHGKRTAEIRKEANDNIDRWKKTFEKKNKGSNRRFSVGKFIDYDNNTVAYRMSIDSIKPGTYNNIDLNGLNVSTNAISPEALDRRVKNNDWS